MAKKPSETPAAKYNRRYQAITALTAAMITSPYYEGKTGATIVIEATSLALLIEGSLDSVADE